MNDNFDELAKGMAQSVTRRGALKKFGIGLAGTVLASWGLAGKAHADATQLGHGNCDHCNAGTHFGCGTDSVCISRCYLKCRLGGG